MFWSNSLGIRFLKFSQNFEIAWASEYSQRSISFYAGHFDIYNWGYLLDFASTHAISSAVISEFWPVFHQKPYLPHRLQDYIGIKRYGIFLRIF